jgi:hypothetical protein
MIDLVPSFPQAAGLVIIAAGRYRPGLHRHHNGFVQHAFATSPWLGAIVVVLIVLGGLAIALIRNAGRVLESTPWYVRVALLVAAGFGISRLLSRKNPGSPQGIWVPPDSSQPTPPGDRAV